MYIREKIQEVLSEFTSDNSYRPAFKLFNYLVGSELPELESNLEYSSVDFVNTHRNTFKSRSIISLFESHVNKIKILTQITNDNVKSLMSSQNLTSYYFNDKAPQSLIFIVVRMNSKQSRKTSYSRITRQINRVYPVPVIILFIDNKKNINISLAFVGRRPHLKQSNLDVIGQSVSLLYKINCVNPHRGHCDILKDLHLPPLINNLKDNTIDGFIKLWLQVLNIENLNKNFYDDLKVWFDSASIDSNVYFPEKYQKNVMGETQQVYISKQEQLIRLITRFMFVWFIKEKGLIPESLFTPSKVFKPNPSEYLESTSSILKNNYDPDATDYYRAILQNLFFATLNTPIKNNNGRNNRGFHGASDNRYDKHHVGHYWLYQELFNNSKLFEKETQQVPFINGGLFDCLDKDSYYLDCFSNDPGISSCISLPNRLFYKGLETSSENRNDGLIDIFNKYKFTIEENTPIDIEVALDPELLGKIFEQLLGYYNQNKMSGSGKDKVISVRKSTGSYYTPRLIVEYMASQSIKEYIISFFKKNDCTIEMKKLTTLFKIDNEENPFIEDSNSSYLIVEALSKFKVLDPSVGSGAFPLEILRLCTNLLTILDPENKQWKACQLDKEKQDDTIVSEDFNKYNFQYLRKLYLIRNSIYGVDVEPIACQIAKLRFFISLIVEQEVGDQENRGIQSLPNLETNIICADTLIPLEKELHTDLYISNTEKIKSEIHNNRNKIFAARTPERKKTLHLENTRLRLKLRDSMIEELLLEDSNENSLDDNTIHQIFQNNLNSKNHKTINNIKRITSWDLMDQNASAEWFDPEWMFGISQGFDIIIGNPPYVKINRIKTDKKILAQEYESAKGRYDLYVIFYEKGFMLLNDSGILKFITPNAWMIKNYGEAIRTKFKNHISAIADPGSGREIFDKVNKYTFITEIRSFVSDKISIVKYDKDYGFKETRKIKKLDIQDPYLLLFSNHIDFIYKVKRQCHKNLKDIAKCRNAGFTNSYYAIKDLITNTDSTKIGKKNLMVVNTGTIGKYNSKWGSRHLMYSGKSFLSPIIDKDLMYKADPQYFTRSNIPKIIIKGMGGDMSADNLTGTIDEDGKMVPGVGTLLIIPTRKEMLSIIAAIINSRLMAFYSMECYRKSSPSDGGIDFQPDMIESLPIPDLETQPIIINKIVTNVEKIIQSGKYEAFDQQPYQRKIDQDIYKLYSLTDKEINIIENAFDK